MFEPVSAAAESKFHEALAPGCKLTCNKAGEQCVRVCMKDLQCKPFVYFLHRFRKRVAEKDLQTSDVHSDCSRKIHRALLRLYRKGGVLPDSVFKLRLKGSDKCISRSGSSRLDNMFGPFGGFRRESLCWSLAHCPFKRRKGSLASGLSLLTPNPFCRVLQHQGRCFCVCVCFGKPRLIFQAKVCVWQSAKLFGCNLMQFRKKGCST